MLSAIAREKQLKKWNRVWKLELIEAQNPEWKDLWDGDCIGVRWNLDSRLHGNDGFRMSSRRIVTRCGAKSR